MNRPSISTDLGHDFDQGCRTASACRREVEPVNIQKVEGILQDMRAAKVVDLATVRQWAEQIDEAISDHLIESLGISFSDESLMADRTAIEFDAEPSDMDAG